jgi:NAD(P)-dependent dehydrogenase (short-subunit alcohol dehydrogenase family)
MWPFPGNYDGEVLMDFMEQQALAGQHAIVTGGASGIGRATCLRLAGLGASVTMVDINPQLLAEAAQEISNVAGVPEPLILTRDISNETDMEDMARVSLEKFGSIDILVHSAGILRGPGSGPKMMADVDLGEWDRVINTNLKGTFLCNRAVLPAMVKQRRGQIINISSTSGLQGRPLDSVYCASKFGVIGLSHALAEEVRPYGIRVQVVAPDAVDTLMWEQNKPVRAPNDALPPSRVADLIVYLLTLPLDAIFGDVVIAPFRYRRRKKSDSPD